MYGGGGDDFFDAGAGNDFLNDGLGNDTIFGSRGDDLMLGEDCNDLVNGDNGNDTVWGGAGDDTVLGGGLEDGGNDFVYGDAGNDIVVGEAGNDYLDGGTGNDTLIGVDTYIREFGYGNDEIDTLTGGQGNDTFVLGSVLQDKSKVVFYNDGDPSTTGTQGYALITDFEVSDLDKIQLIGSQDSYSLGSSPSGLTSGTGIFYLEGTAGAVPELIAILENVSPSQLNLTNSNQFTYV